MYRKFMVDRECIAPQFTIIFTFLAVVFASSCAADSPRPLATITHPLEIGRNPSSSLSNAAADSILADGTQLLRQCNAQFTRSGGVVSLNTLPSVISSEATFRSACQASSLGKTDEVDPLGVPRRVRLVNSINWCGTIGTTIIGCANTPGICMVVRRLSASQASLEGILWTHEFGHSKGLQHRTNSTNAIMYPSIGASRTVFSSSECNRIRTLGFRSYPSTINSNTGFLTRLPIQEFVRKVYPQGVPYNEARLYSSSEVDTIEPWLSDINHDDHWSNVATVIGIVASSDSYQILNGFVFSSGTGQLPIEQWDGRFSAIISMGYVVANNGDQDAFNFLQARAVPAAWSDVSWQAPFHSSMAETRNDLATAASLGLALSGERGRIAIEQLKSGAFNQLSDDDERILLLNSLIEEANKIERNGLSSYYSQ